MHALRQILRFRRRVRALLECFRCVVAVHFFFLAWFRAWTQGFLSMYLFSSEMGMRY
jgi:hypothetical protein